MKSQRLWVSLGTQDLAFNRNTLLAQCIRSLTFEDIQHYADQLAKRERCGELILYSKGKFDGIEMRKKRMISSISDFKQQIPYY